MGETYMTSKMEKICNKNGRNSQNEEGGYTKIEKEVTEGKRKEDPLCYLNGGISTYKAMEGISQGTNVDCNGNR